MFKRPRWKKRWLYTIRNNRHSSTKNLLGLFSCLIGLGMVMAVIPGWLLLIFLGSGLFLFGISILH